MENLYRPAVCWYEYKGSEGSEFTRKKNREKSHGITLELIEDDNPPGFFHCPEHEEWYLEEGAD